METTATMPKMKTHSGTAKRFRLTGTGKVMRRRANRGHLFEKKSSRLTRRLYGEVTLAPRDRKDRKGNFRRLWIQRINAAARANGMTYNRFVQGLRIAGVEVDRRMLAELAVADETAFSALVEVAKKALPDAAGSAAA